MHPHRPDQRPPRRAGTQAVQRACALLTILSTHGRNGLTLGAIAVQAGLDRATVRRLLLELMANGFVAQDAPSRRYCLGINLFSIAAVAVDRFDLATERRGALAALSQATRCTAAYFARSEDDLVCVDCVEVDSGGHGTQIGMRRPIGIDAFGIALLAGLPEVEAEALLIRNVRRHAHASEARLRDAGRQMRQTRGSGYSVSLDGQLEVCAIAVALADREGDAEGVIGVVSPIHALPLSSTEAGRLVAHHAKHLQYKFWRLPHLYSKPGVAGNSLVFA